MQEKQVTAAGETYELPDPFFVLATQNPIDQGGTYPLPEAQTDRFLMKILVDYPEFDEERTIVEQYTAGRAVPVERSLTRSEIRRYSNWSVRCLSQTTCATGQSSSSAGRARPTTSSSVPARGRAWHSSDGEGPGVPPRPFARHRRGHRGAGSPRVRHRIIVDLRAEREGHRGRPHRSPRNERLIDSLFSDRLCTNGRDSRDYRPDLLDELGRFTAALNRQTTSIRQGDQQSPRVGEGLTFSDHRRYPPGDDTRRIDWKVYARTEESSSSGSRPSGA